MNTLYSGDDPLADTKLGNALTRAIVDTIHDPFLVLDADLRIIVASRSFYEKFKVDKDDTQGCLLYEIGDGQYNVPALRHFLKNIIPEHREMREYKMVHNFTTVGPLTLLLGAREVHYENSRHKHLLLTIGDISGQEFFEAEKERLSQKKDLMIKEMKHRMANSLQLIASILILKSEVVESVEVRSHLQEAHERIMSIATIEKYLDTNVYTEEVEVGPYLRGLCDSLSKSVMGSEKNITLSVESDGGMTSSAHSINLGLITAELVINALKHAFKSRDTGTIVVSYLIDNEGWTLSVRDDGSGYAPEAIRKDGLGTSIVHSLARQLEALVNIQTGTTGTTVSISHKETTSEKAAA